MRLPSWWPARWRRRPKYISGTIVDHDGPVVPTYAIGVDVAADGHSSMVVARRNTDGSTDYKLVDLVEPVGEGTRAIRRDLSAMRTFRGIPAGGCWECGAAAGVGCGDFCQQAHRRG